MERLETVAFVLNTEPVGDYGLSVDLISPAYGRIKVLSRHGRGRKSPLKALLQIFTPLHVEYKMEAHNKVLCGCSVVGMPFVYTPPLLFNAFYINEVTANFFKEEGENTLFFASYLRALTELYHLEKGNCAISQFKQTLEQILRNFELDVIGYTGLNFDWRFDAYSGERICPDKKYTLDVTNGFHELVNSEVLTSGLSIYGSDIEQIASRNFTASSLDTAKKICRVFLSYLLAGKTLNSKSLYLDYIKHS